MKACKPSEIIEFKHKIIVFYSTDKCDLKCRWCLRNTDASKDLQHRKMMDLDFKTFEKVLKISPHVESIGFAGQGEPLLNEDLFDMIEYASRKKIGTCLNTNSIAFDDEKIKKLIGLNVLQVNCSLKGKDSKEFAEVTRVDEKLFQKQIENIQKLAAYKKSRKSNAIIRISYVVDRDNFGNMEKVITLAESLGVDKLLLDNLVPFHDFETGTGCIFEDDSEVKEHIEHLRKRSSKVKINFPVLLKRKDFSYYCPGYYKLVHMDAEGNLSGCMRVLTPHPQYGNIFKDKDYMNTPHFRNTRKMFLNKELPQRCRFCVDMSLEKNFRK